MPTKIYGTRKLRSTKKAGTKIRRKRVPAKRRVPVLARLSTSYRGVPNKYAFIRETRPITIDLGTAGSGVTLVAGTGTIPNLSIFSFPNFAIDQLPGFSDFSNLFASYKIDKVEVNFVPMWDSTVQQTVNPLTGAWTGTSYVPNLVITRINTKYLTNGYVVQSTAEANRDQLAQIIKKSRTLYGSKKWLKCTTDKPRIFQEILESRAGVSDNLISRSSPWLPTVQAADQEFLMNDMIFADRIDGTNFLGGIHKYRVYTKVHFRCSFVG